jgi:Tfp pilus assembly protein PilV
LGEVVLALLIFALSSAVCVGLLFRAYRISEASSKLNRAVFCVQSAAETFKSQPKLENVAAVLGGDLQSGSCFIYYNEDWQQTTKQDAFFTMLITPHSEDGITYAKISLSDEAGSVFELTATAYQEEGRR